LPDGRWKVCGNGCAPETESFGIKPKFNALAGKLTFTVKGLDQGSGGDDPGQAFCLPTEKFLKVEKAKQFMVAGVVPAYVSGKATVSTCVNVQYVWSSDGFPVMRVEPTIAVEAQGKLAIGVNTKGLPKPPVEPPSGDKGDKKAKKDKDSETGIGIRLTILLIRLGFPIARGTVATPVVDASLPGSPVVQKIFDVNIYEKVYFRLATLGGSFALWGGFGIGPFKIELVIPLFSWKPLEWEWEIKALSKDVLKKVVDLLATFPHPGAKVPQTPICSESASSNPCGAQ